MKAVELITGVAGAIISLGSLCGFIGVSHAIIAVVLMLASVLLLVRNLP